MLRFQMKVSGEIVAKGLLQFLKLIRGPMHKILAGVGPHSSIFVQKVVWKVFPLFSQFGRFAYYALLL